MHKRCPENKYSHLNSVLCFASRPGLGCCLWFHCSGSSSHLFSCSLAQACKLLLCLLLLLDPPHELHSFPGSMWSLTVLLSRCMQAPWCQTLPLTVCLPCSVKLMSIICFWFLISDCLNYISWLLPPPRLQPRGLTMRLATPMSRHNSLHRQVPTDSSLFR